MITTPLSPSEVNQSLAGWVGHKRGHFSPGPPYGGWIGSDQFQIRRYTGMNLVGPKITGNLRSGQRPTTYDVVVGGAERFIHYAVAAYAVLGLVGLVSTVGVIGMAWALPAALVMVVILGATAGLYHREVRRVSVEAERMLQGLPPEIS